jgi:hypothetical protein
MKKDMDKNERAARRYAKRSTEDDTEEKGEGGAEAEAEKTASGKGAPKAEPGEGDKEVTEKPNAVGAEPMGSDTHSEMTSRHTAELEAMHKRHQQEAKDMHGRHMNEMSQMHGRHAEEIGNGAGAAATKGPALDSGKRKWKTVEKGKGGSEPKGEK